MAALPTAAVAEEALAAAEAGAGLPTPAAVVAAAEDRTTEAEVPVLASGSAKKINGRGSGAPWWNSQTAAVLRLRRMKTDRAGRTRIPSPREASRSLARSAS